MYIPFFLKKVTFPLNQPKGKKEFGGGGGGGGESINIFRPVDNLMISKYLTVSLKRV